MLCKITLQKNDKKAKKIIWIFTLVVFTAVVFLDRIKLNIELPFNPHYFAALNATLNTIIAILLIIGLIAIKNKQMIWHKRCMLMALILSVVFLISYILHKLFAGESKFGDINFDGILSNEEKISIGFTRTIYLIILSSHILLAAIILPFILYTAYRALIGEYSVHKRLARITYPIWLYVAITGPVVYWMIKPYYT